MALLVDVVVLGDITHGMSVAVVLRERKDEVNGEGSLLNLGEKSEEVGSERQARECSEA